MSVFVAFFVLFFALAALAVHFSDARRVRRGFVVALLLVTLAVNVVGVNLLPVAHLHKYTAAPDATDIHYEIRVADGSGAEIRYDPRAIPPVDERIVVLAERMVEEQSRAEQVETARLLLSNAIAYRARIESSLAPRLPLGFPPPAVMDRWTEADLEPYGSFTTVRIYHVQRTYVDGGYRVRERTETLAIELAPRVDRPVRTPDAPTRPPGENGRPDGG